MVSIYLKILKTKNEVVQKKDIMAQPADVVVLGNAIKTKVGKLFNGSLAIRQVDAGSDNACEQELVALGNAFYDVERFGVHFVASPRHADMLMVTGPVTRNMKSALISAFDATPTPKIVVAVGDDAIDGGIFKDTYAVVGGVDAVIPVDYSIPGDPPSPVAILSDLLKILEDLDKHTLERKND
jgi:Ni,Fe-hydrogenase III small subunit